MERVRTQNARTAEYRQKREAESVEGEYFSTVRVDSAETGTSTCISYESDDIMRESTDVRRPAARVCRTH